MTTGRGHVTVTEQTPSRWLVEMIGEFDVENAPHLIEAFAAVPTENELVVDLSQTTFLDSSAAHELLKIHYRLKPPYGAPVTLVCPPGSSAHRFLDLTGIGDIFLIHPTRADAGLPEVD